MCHNLHKVSNWYRGFCQVLLLQTSLWWMMTKLFYVSLKISYLSYLRYLSYLIPKMALLGLKVCVFIILHNIAKEPLTEAVSVYSLQQCGRVLISLRPCQYSINILNFLIFANQRWKFFIIVLICISLHIRLGISSYDYKFQNSVHVLCPLFQ